MRVKKLLLSMTLAVLAISVALGQGGVSGPAKKPKEFPAVPVAKGAAISYATVALDSWTSKVAYVLIEGNTTNGFTRAFAWIPGDSRFGRPVEWKPKSVETNPNLFFFGELENRDTEGDEKMSITWRLSVNKRVRGAGSDTVVDYVSGKTVARNWGAATWHVVMYQTKLGYAYGKSPTSSMDGGYPLELTMADDLRLYDKWEKVPEPGGGGFQVGVYLKHLIQETRDPKVGRLLCQFAAYNGWAVQKAPGDMAVTLTVTPYMGVGVPAYSNKMSMAEFQKTGFDLDVPYGWYSLRLSGFRYGRFAFIGVFNGINGDLVPLARPLPDG